MTSSRSAGTSGPSGPPAYCRSLRTSWAGRARNRTLARNCCPGAPPCSICTHRGLSGRSALPCARNAQAMGCGCTSPSPGSVWRVSPSMAPSLQQFDNPFIRALSRWPARYPEEASEALFGRARYVAVFTRERGGAVGVERSTGPHRQRRYRRVQVSRPSPHPQVPAPVRVGGREHVDRHPSVRVKGDVDAAQK